MRTKLQATGKKNAKAQTNAAPQNSTTAQVYQVMHTLCGSYGAQTGTQTHDSTTNHSTRYEHPALR